EVGGSDDRASGESAGRDAGPVPAVARDPPPRPESSWRIRIPTRTRPASMRTRAAAMRGRSMKGDILTRDRVPSQWDGAILAAPPRGAQGSTPQNPEPPSVDRKSLVFTPP